MGNGCAYVATSVAGNLGDRELLVLLVLPEDADDAVGEDANASDEPVFSPRDERLLIEFDDGVD